MPTSPTLVETSAPLRRPPWPAPVRAGRARGATPGRRRGGCASTGPTTSTGSRGPARRAPRRSRGTMPHRRPAPRDEHRREATGTGVGERAGGELAAVVHGAGAGGQRRLVPSSASGRPGRCRSSAWRKWDLGDGHVDQRACERAKAAATSAQTDLPGTASGPPPGASAVSVESRQTLEDAMTEEQQRGYGQYCPISRALEVLGERWTMLIVRRPVARQHAVQRASAGQVPGCRACCPNASGSSKGPGSSSTSTTATS